MRPGINQESFCMEKTWSYFRNSPERGKNVLGQKTLLHWGQQDDPEGKRAYLKGLRTSLLSSEHTVEGET